MTTILPWPNETTSQAASHPNQLLASLDPNLQLEMSGVHWNEKTNTLWATAGGGSGKGTWALQYNDQTDSFEILGFWTSPRDEDITQVSLDPVTSNKHRIFILNETSYKITQALMTVNLSGSDTSVSERSWTISEIAPSGKSGAEGLCFVPDNWLTTNGFVDSSGAPYVSQGGFGGLFFVAHQNGGYIYAIDLSSTGSAMFNSKTYKIVGVYKTSLTESSALCFDRSVGKLYISHNTGGNVLEVTNLTSIAITGDAKANRKFVVLDLFKSPSLSNPEGFARTPEKLENGTTNPNNWAFFANDCETTDSTTNKSRAIVWYKNFRTAR